ncbi:MAG TPA: glycosyltransferase [Niabella sp.]
MFIWYTIQLIAGVHLVLPLFFYLLFNIVKKKPASAQTTALNEEIGIIVTAYQEIAHIPATVQSILDCKYSHFVCYVVLDNCDDISSLQFTDDRVVLLKPSTVLGGNVYSHLYAIDHFIRPHKYFTIIDSDNLVEENYLTQIAGTLQQGYTAVQGIREAKNLNTQYACLDAARDLYYHFYDGLVLYRLGSSATLAGSGMAFETELYKECLGIKQVSGAGFDKVLQYEIVKRNVRIAYNDQAIVYDQKTAHPEQLVNQRARWINTWFKYFSYGFDLLFRSLRYRSWNQLLFGLILLRPPLFMLLSVAFLFMVANLFLSPYISLIWGAGLLCFILGFTLALYYYKADKKIINALKRIPFFIYYQFVSLFYSRKANQRSVATRHFTNHD